MKGKLNTKIHLINNKNTSLLKLTQIKVCYAHLFPDKLLSELLSDVSWTVGVSLACRVLQFDVFEISSEMFMELSRLSAWLAFIAKFIMLAFGFIMIWFSFAFLGSSIASYSWNSEIQSTLVISNFKGPEFLVWDNKFEIQGVEM